MQFFMPSLLLGLASTAIATSYSVVTHSENGCTGTGRNIVGTDPTCMTLAGTKSILANFDGLTVTAYTGSSCTGESASVTSGTCYSAGDYLVGSYKIESA
ncbi:hypothetical protein N7456_006047 [Penicillium angulare]|uniref:Uncharacterized protein n=1 Tax=Penicillium angulare TaxID=116970 RepID=A0A9W9G183_9EURO|nr:hypothetical protein N7456_006047 [Penicillium angulare]